MSILGSTDLGDGSLYVKVDHNPVSVQTDVPIGSLILYNALLYEKISETATPADDVKLVIRQDSAVVVEAIVKKFQETSGPITLGMGNVSDGRILRRVGSEVVGVTPESLNTAAPGQAVGGEVIWVNNSQIKIGRAGEESNIRAKNLDYSIRWTGELLADITVSGAGGLDTGTEAANTWYAVHVIADTSGINPVDVLLSLQKDPASLPSGYDAYRRLGWVRNDNLSNFLRFTQLLTGQVRHVLYETERSQTQVVSGGTATSFSTVSLASYVPSTARIVFCTVGVDTRRSSDQVYFRTTGSGLVNPITFFSLGVVTVNVNKLTLPLTIEADATQQIDYRIVEGGPPSGGRALDLYVRGYADTL